MMDLLFHEAADIFPPLGRPELQLLAEDIRQNGLQIPIELLDGKIIDGRSRYQGCLKAGVEPDVIDVDPDDPVGYVLSMNLHRRHLSECQRAMVAARAKDFYVKKAKERQKTSTGGKEPQLRANLPQADKGKARDQAGAAAGVSGKSVDHATKVIDRGSKSLQQAVNAGTIPVSSAAKLVDLPKAEQSRIAKSENPAAEARKAAAPKKPQKNYADLLAAAFTELGDRVDSIVEQYGSLTKMFNSPEWRDCDCYYTIETIAELRKLFDRLNTEAQKYARAKSIKL